jgi:hypothetical protein
VMLASERSLGTLRKASKPWYQALAATCGSILGAGPDVFRWI